MDVEEHSAERSLSSPVLPATNTWNDDLLSPEDVAWLDSCLVKDADISSNNWDAVKDALLDLISSELNLTSSSATEIDIHQSEMDAGISPSSKQILTSKIPARRGTNLILTENEEVDGGDLSSQEEPSSPTIFKDVFQPNYKEFLEDMFNQDEELKPYAYEAELLHEDIFKVWDLDVPDEAEELVSHLEKALALSSSVQPQQSLPGSDNAGNLREPEADFVIVDDLVSGIADLSLQEMSL